MMRHIGLTILVVIFSCALAVAATNNPVIKEHPELLSLSDAFADIAEMVNPSVVNIAVTEKSVGPHNEKDQSDDEDDNDDDQKDEDQYGFGSGVIIDVTGFILTSNHVIEGASKIEVKLSDNRKFTAKVIGQDQETDLALVKVDSDQPLPAAVLGDSEKLRPGQWVMAIGNPFVYDHTVTVGVISALNRNLGTTVFDNFIQTDAAINFGNSGGPLLNLKGEVIGINTLISSQGSGIGFAIPINTAKQILEQLKQKGKVSRGFLGLVPQEITPELQKALDLSVEKGVIVSSIQSGSPADQVGLRRYDVILQVNGQKVDSEDAFRRMVADIAPGTTVQLQILRDGKTLNVAPKLSERNANLGPPAPPEKPLENKFGIVVHDLNAQLRDDYRIDENTKGLLVLTVTSGSPADDAGLAKGDVISEVNKKPVGNSTEFIKLLNSLKSGEVLVLYVVRGSSSLFLTLTTP